MKLFTSLPARKDGTLIVRHKGASYVFTGKPLSCEIEDEEHAEDLRGLNFQTQEEFEAEQKFLRLQAEREARRAALEGNAQSSRGTFSPALGAEEDDEDSLDGGTGLPQESNSAPTGRVRRAARSSVVTG